MAAFQLLAAELAAHGARAALIGLAYGFARDELRHARFALARRFGGIPTPAHVEARPVGSLAAIALENAVADVCGRAMARWWPRTKPMPRATRRSPQ